MLVRISGGNRVPEAALLDVLPSMWFRNIWTWWPGVPKPGLRQIQARNCSAVLLSHPEAGQAYLYCEGSPPLLFTENETNHQRLFGKPNVSPYVKDGVNDYLVHGKRDAVNPARE